MSTNSANLIPLLETFFQSQDWTHLDKNERMAIIRRCLKSLREEYDILAGPDSVSWDYNDSELIGDHHIFPNFDMSPIDDNDTHTHSDTNTDYDTDPNPDYGADYDAYPDSDIDDYDTDVDDYDPPFDNRFNEIYDPDFDDYDPDFDDDYHVKDLAPGPSNRTSVKRIPCRDHTDIPCPKRIQCRSVGASPPPQTSSNTNTNAPHPLSLPPPHHAPSHPHTQPYAPYITASTNPTPSASHPMIGRNNTSRPRKNLAIKTIVRR
ncbi:hypothetical protein P691DRAFT_768691 [Macrolepiota fuliginosa MF-IS2]|uniref:Uncharacterized protein n=1 Tax=Macrolepiota fuliginosa MF-IS2 TaxID=1400762 RepID=A0A9P5WY21_9AGAR|nr:hypothetical protein P691DRAFT_768691 [Macrolepiota fuliginosa MF-IS2]